MQADFYTVYDSKVDITLDWYGAHLSGFKTTHAYAASRSQDTLYNPGGTLAVSVTGSSGKADETLRPSQWSTLAFSPPFQRRRSSASISKK
jgi:hypothetical protein